MGSSWTRCWREELKIKKLYLSLPKPELLLQPQWDIGPGTWLFYRFFMLAYTLGWCVYSGLLFSDPRWLLFLSHLTYCLMGVYYLVALCNLAVATALVRRFCRDRREASRAGSSAVGQCSESMGPFPLPSPLAASLRLQWFLHTIIGSFSLIVSFLYWSIDHPITHHPLTAFNINMHVGNSAQTLLDLALSATPVYLPHYVYLLLVSCLYVLFAVAYWLGGLTNLNGKPYIYMVLDFGGRPVLATLTVLGFTLICLPFFHFLLWNLYLLRRCLAARVKGGQLALSRERWWWRVGEGTRHFLYPSTTRPPRCSQP